MEEEEEEPLTPKPRAKQKRAAPGPVERALNAL